MKKSFHLIAAALLCSCSIGGIDLFPHSWRGGQGEGIPPQRDSTKDDAVPDTSVFLACGITRLEDGREPVLVLLKDFKKVLELECSDAARISPDPDLHHIVDDALFTQYSSRDSTFVKRNGEPLLCFEGREYIRGILPMGEDTYTLGLERSGNGFALRKNGKTVFMQQQGSIDGGFSDKDYDGNGALFADDGRVCFRFIANGRTSLVIDGVTVNDDSPLKETHRISRVIQNRVYFPSDSTMCKVRYKDGVLYFSGLEIESDCMFFPPQAGCCEDGIYYLAVSSRTGEWKPYVWRMGLKKELSGIDMVTAISFHRKPTSG